MFDSLDVISPLDSTKEIFVHDCLRLLGITLLYYDHLITLRIEIDCVWRRPKSRSAYWFFFTRYFAFFSNLAITILSSLTLSPKSCHSYSLFRQLQLVTNQVLVCVLLTLRTYALYNFSKRILSYMACSGAVLAGVACWSLFGQRSVGSEQSWGCHFGSSSITAVRLAGGWEALFVYDSIIFFLTMIKTWRGRYESGILVRPIPVVQIIFRDGAVYFAVMALANLGNILTFYFPGPFLKGCLSTFANAISVNMVSRLMLNLHEMADAGLYSTRHINITDPHMERSTGVELDTLWSGDFVVTGQDRSWRGG